MIIMESAIAMNNDYIECSNTLGKIDLFAEASYKEYNINLKEVALKVLQENGTESDFDFLATEAAAGYIERAKKAIEKIIEAVKKFLHNCKENLIKMVTNVKTQAAVDKAEEACKADSKLRSCKVEYQNTDKHVGILQQGIDRIRKKVAKIKAKGIATTEDIEELGKVEEDTMKKVYAISIATVVTLGTAIALFKHFNSRTEVEAAINEDAISDCDIIIDDDNAKTAETAAFYTRASGVIARLKREKAAKKAVKATSLLAAIKSTINKFKGKVSSENLEEQTNESTLEDLTLFACICESTTEENSTETNNDNEDNIAESVGIVEGLDLDTYFTELCNELFTNVTESTEEIVDTNTTIEVEESATTTENTEMTAETYMEQLEREIFGEDEVVATESSDNDSIQSLLDEMEALL